MSENNDSPEQQIQAQAQAESTGEMLSHLKANIEELNLRLEVIDKQRGFFLRQLTEESVHLAKAEKRIASEISTVSELRSELEEYRELLNHAREEARSANSMVKLHQARMGVVLDFVQMILGADYTSEFPLPETLTYNNIAAWVSNTQAALEARLLDEENAKAEPTDEESETLAVGDGEETSFEMSVAGEEMPADTPVDIELPVLTTKADD